MLGNRSLHTVAKAVFGKQHYTALWNMYRNYPDFLENFKRYITGKGTYPYMVRINTPSGTVAPELYSHHDLLTVNEIFCRQDYYAGEDVNVVVDLGSNIGISALYFLTRNEKSKCYLYEPVPENIKKLKKTLSDYSGRYFLHEVAVSDRSGILKFGVEETGRYGGIGINTGKTIEVKCLNINDVLEEVLSRESCIDILKLDIEGEEVRAVESIRPEILRKINNIYLEAYVDRLLHNEIFNQSQYGVICHLSNKSVLE